MLRLVVQVLTITETNNGDSPLTDVYVNVMPSDTRLDINSKEFIGGDDSGDGILDPGETWEWRMVIVSVAGDHVVVAGDAGAIDVTATGHGTDPVGWGHNLPSLPHGTAHPGSTDCGPVTARVQDGRRYEPRAISFSTSIPILFLTLGDITKNPGQCPGLFLSGPRLKRLCRWRHGGETTAAGHDFPGTPTNYTRSPPSPSLESGSVTIGPF